MAVCGCFYTYGSYHTAFLPASGNQYQLSVLLCQQKGEKGVLQTFTGGEFHLDRDVIHFEQIGVFDLLYKRAHSFGNRKGLVDGYGSEIHKLIRFVLFNIDMFQIIQVSLTVQIRTSFDGNYCLFGDFLCL
jgi:hypothetical protein